MSARILLIAVLALFSIATPAKGEVLDSLRQCVKIEFQKEAAVSEASQWAACITDEGKWPDIDYADQSGSRWQLEKHLDRIIAIGRWKPEHPAAVKALRHWFAGNYRSSNWWYNKIGIPRRLLAIAYLLDDVLTPDLRAELAESLSIIDANDFPARPGGDRIQVLSNHAKVLLWKRDAMEAPNLFRLIEAEARIAPIEEVMYDAGGGMEVRNGWPTAGRGFQSDMSFHHRGDRVDCTVTYGMEIPEFFSYWEDLLRDTPWAFSRESRDFVHRYMEEAVRWHLVKDFYTEPSAYNRELARPVTAPFAFTFDDPTPLSGARYFPESAYFSFKRPGFETAVRMHSERNANQEAAHNSEGIHNHYRGDGACHLTVSGREYLNIWPLFDFRKVPGATTPLTSYADMPANAVQRRESPIKFAGAVTDNEFGAVGFDFKTCRNDLCARKSWFFFDEGYVCLGSGISSTSADTIVTTVEQCLSDADEFECIDGRITHNGNTYIVLEGNAAVSHSPRHGDWSNCVLNAEQSAFKAEGKVFAIEIDHGVAPKDARYAYAVAPNATAPELWFNILEHTDSLHAISSIDGNLVYAVFFEPGILTSGDTTIQVSHPCMAMLHAGNLYLADPTHSIDSIEITISGNNGIKTHQVAMPQFPNAGTTIRVTD